MRKRSLFAIPIFDRWLLHAPLHEISALVNASAYESLIGGQPPSGDIADLQAALTQAPTHSPVAKSGQYDPRFLAIVTTRGCNIDCVYCDFGGPTSKKIHMEPEIAVESISWMADQLIANGRDDFFLHFFGGEPFISGELVEIIVHRTRAICAERGLRPYFDVSTNGIFSARRAEWIGDYFDSVVLSFDGSPKFQNRNRPGKRGSETFDAVSATAHRLSRSPLELCLRVCITGESAARMPEITRWMAEEYQPAVINFEPLTENDLTADVQLPAADPFEFAEKWMESKRIAASLGVKLVYSATESGSPRHSSCPVGGDTAVITPDGSVNGCYLQPGDWIKHGMNMGLGRVKPGSGVSLQVEQIEQLRSLVTDKPRCESCFCQWSCAGGCHVSNTYKGCSDSYVSFCHQTRLITACLLLEELGQDALVAKLLADRGAMEKIARHPWDPITLSDPCPESGYAKA